MVKEFVFDRIYGVVSPLFKLFFHNYVSYLSIKNIWVEIESVFSNQNNDWDLPLRKKTPMRFRAFSSLLSLTSSIHDVNLNFGNDGRFKQEIRRFLNCKQKILPKLKFTTLSATSTEKAFFASVFLLFIYSITTASRLNKQPFSPSSIAASNVLLRPKWNKR